MADLVTAAQIYPALKALLGLPDLCTKFELRVSCDDVVTVACEHYVSLDAAGIADLTRVFGEYELVRRDQTVPPQQAEVVDFDAWMLERTERAHAAYMASHAAGGIDYSKRRKFATGGMVIGHRLVGEAS